MGLLLYPLFAAMTLIFWVLVVATAITIYVGAYAIVALLTLGAMIVRSAWRPLYPRRPKLLGGQGHAVRPSSNVAEDSVWASSEAIPQARFSDRR
jgi:hypothetical protein